MQDGRNRNNAGDGACGPGTEQAVQRYERSLGIEPPTGQVDATLFAQLRADTLRGNPEFKRHTMTDLYGPLRDNSLDPGEKGEPLFDTRLPFEALSHNPPPPRTSNNDRTHNQHPTT